MNEIKEIFNKLKTDKKSILLIAAAAACIVLLVLSGFSDEKRSSQPENTQTASAELSAEYIKDKQRELEALLSTIDGAGEVKVMLTLDSFYEKDYSKELLSKNEESGEDKQKSEYTESVVTLKNGSNSELALVAKIYEPQIRGVAVTAQGGGSAAVKRAITDTVCAVFGISSTRVSVEKMKNTNR